MLKLLVESSAKINTFSDRTLWGPLHWCCHYGDTESVKFLLEKGAFAFLPDHRGFLPLDLAANEK